MATGTPSNVKTAEGDASFDLPAPAGWIKKVTPKKGATPSKNEIVFIAPDGVEIKTKSKLREYLKSHPSGVTLKEFDWSTLSTGDNPRRSSRLSGGKSKVSESPVKETPKKRQRKSSSKKETKEKGDGSEDEATSEGGKEAPEASNADAKESVEHVDKDVGTEKDGVDDPVKGGDVGKPAAEEEKTDAMELESVAGEEKSDVKEPEAAAEEERSAVVKEQEAAAAEEQEAVGVEEEKSDVKDQVGGVEEEKSDVKDQVGGGDDEKADVIEEAADMDVLLGADDNVKEDVQVEIGEKKEGDQVSDSSKQSNGGEQKEEGVAVSDTSHPSQVSEEDKQASDFLASLPDNFLDDALAGSAGGPGSHPKVEETADPVGEGLNESSSKDEAENQQPVGDVDAAMQEANIEENQQQDPSTGL